MAPRDKKTKLQIQLEQHQLKHHPCPWPATFPHFVSFLWDVDLGHHPAQEQGEAFYNAAAKLGEDVNLQHFQNHFLPMFPCLDGHNLATSVGAARTLEIDDKVPLSPLFVRDLSGRVICIGYGPEVKKEAAWKGCAAGTFPHHCQDVTVETVGADLIEQVFFTRFRTLDYTPKLAYPAPENYPYKLRLDTFYQDGWRLPQTALVYARPNMPKAKKLGEDLLAKWKARPEGQSYEEFYEAAGGEAWFESLFEQGCTLVPTFEAANGYHHVSADFELEDFWPGRAVDTLHDVVETKADSAPKGTILAVQEPGFVTAAHVHKAKVVVSDGSGYKTPHTDDPAPHLPDLRLPHQRASTKWEAFWLPTHPSHFEAPALWGWDAQTGHFLQQEGPLWDPLHYFYASQPLVLRAFRNPLSENAYLAPVPEKMKTRFYPIVPMAGRDEQNLEVFSERRVLGMFPCSRADHVLTKQPSTNIGYHPMPAWFEYELDTFFYPELAPQNRVSAPPADVEKRVLGVIEVDGKKVEFLELGRYVAAAEIPENYPWPVFEPDYDERLYRHVGEELWRTPAQQDFMKSLAPDFLKAALEWKENAKKNRLLRRALVSSSAAWVQLATWQSLSVERLEALSRQQLVPKQEEAA